MASILLICNAGFEDILTLGRQSRPDPYVKHVGVSPWVKWLPLDQRIGISARMKADGSELIALNLQELRNDLDRRYFDAPSAIAICLFHSLVNAVHERELELFFSDYWPGCTVVLSSSLAPHFPNETWLGGEFERTAASVRAAAAIAQLNLDEAHEALPQFQEPLAVALAAIADAMQATMVSQAVSSVVREAMDCAAAIFLPNGRLIAQARSLPLLTGSLGPAVRAFLELIPTHQLSNGEVYLWNDPWIGGTHLPDFIVLKPHWHKGSLAALFVCILHHQDVGGISAGSVPPDATHIAQEGLRIPPIRLIQNDQIDQAILQMISANSRQSEALKGDLAAQLSALTLAAQNMNNLLAKTPDFINQATSLLQQSDQNMRAHLLSIADGKSTADDALDGDGLSEAPVAVSVTLRKRGSELTIDLSACANQTQGPINASRSASFAAIDYFARSLVAGSLGNDGCTEAFTVISRPGSIVDPSFPAPLNARTNLVKMLTNTLLAAWNQLVPHASAAPNAGVAAVLSLSGLRGDQSSWQLTEIIASAAGGAPWGAGGSGCSTDIGNARNTPIETIEAQAPLLLTSAGLNTGSGGAGINCGGDGIRRIYRLLEGNGAISYRGERHRTAAQGANGGEPGRCGRAILRKSTGKIIELPSKIRIAWAAGDELIIETAGAGGWGKPLG